MALALRARPAVLRQALRRHKSSSADRDFFGCEQSDLDARDAKLAASQAAFEKRTELSLGPPLGDSALWKLEEVSS